eukprot:COSAG01_NODE_1845_length_9070_cov_16.651806_5_plen_195_part_00
MPDAEVVFTAIHLVDGRATALSRANLTLPRGANSVAWFCAGGGKPTPPAVCLGWQALLPTIGCTASGTNCVITATVTDVANGAVLASNVQLLTPPGKLNASRTVRITALVGEANATDGSVPVTITAASGSGSGGGGAPALFVTLSTAANGRFDDNFLTLLQGSRVLRFLPFAPDQRDVLAHTLRVNTLGEQLMT